jgi:hypothetical protein
MNILQQAARRLERLEALDKVARPLAGAVGRAVRPRVVRNLLSGTDLGHPLHPMLTDLPRPAARGHNQHCTGAVLAPGVSCNVDLRFRPTTMGPRAATLDVTANVAAYGVTLHAVGLGPNVIWTQASLDFGDTKVGVQTPAQTVGLINQGNAPLTITLVDTSGDGADFTLIDMTPGIVTLPPNAEKVFQVRFKATASGNRQASLRVHAGFQIYAVTFTGVGGT